MVNIPTFTTCNALPINRSNDNKNDNDMMIGKSRKRCRPRLGSDIHVRSGTVMLSIIFAVLSTPTLPTGAMAQHPPPQPQQPLQPQQQQQRRRQRRAERRRRRRRQQQQQQQQQQQPPPLESWIASSCPPSPYEGWMTSPPACTTYYWCQDGKRGSLDYHCPEGQVFHIDVKKCEFSWGGVGGDGCSGGGGAEAKGDDVEIGDLEVELQEEEEDRDAGDAHDATMTANNTNSTINFHNHNYNYTAAEITALQNDPSISFLQGPKVYYSSPSTTSCLRSTPSSPAPSWMTDDHLFSLKHECCAKMYGWMDLDACLGPGFVETNFRIVDPLAPTGVPSASPSQSAAPTSSATTAPTGSTAPTTDAPTISSRPSATNAAPTKGPTLSPIVAPTERPSSSPSTNPTSSPSTDAPTWKPTTVAPTASPSGLPTESPVRVNFVVEKMEIEPPSMWGSVGYPREDPLAAFSFDGGDDDGYGGSNGGVSHADGFASEGRPQLQPQLHSHPQQQTEPIVTELILPARADATVSQQRPDITFGTNAALAVDAGDADGVAAYSDLFLERFDSLVKFDLSMVAAENGKEMESAVLELFSLGSCSHGGNFYLATNTDMSSSSSSSPSSTSWEPDTVNWNNAPATTSHRDKVGTLGPVALNEWYRIQLDTTSLRSFLDDERHAELTIRIEASPESSDRCLYASVDNPDATKAPRLIVEYRPLPPPTPPPTAPIPVPQLQSQQPLHDPSSSNAALLPPLLPTSLYPPSTTGDFTLLRAIDDTTLDILHPTKPFGHLPHLTVRFDSHSRYVSDALIRFDLRTLQPSPSNSQSSYVRRPPRSALLLLFAETDCPIAGLLAATTTVDITTTYSNHGENQHPRHDVTTTTTTGSWSQDTTTWSNAPSTPRDVEVGTFGKVTENVWHGFDVVGAVEMAMRAGKEEMTFRLRGVVDDGGYGGGASGSGEEGNGCRYSSIESGRAPKLMVAFA